MTEKKRIKESDLLNIDIIRSPEILITTVDLLKEICQKIDLDYTELLIEVGLQKRPDNPKAKKAKDNEENTEDKLKTALETWDKKISTLIFDEYNRETKKHGPTLTSVYNHLYLALDEEYPVEVLMKSDTAVIISLLMLILINPQKALNKSFLDVAPTT